MTIVHDSWDLYIGDTWRLTFNCQEADGTPMTLSSVTEIIWKLDDATNTRNWITTKLSTSGISILDAGGGVLQVVVDSSTLPVTKRFVPDGIYRDELTIIDQYGTFTMSVGPVVTRAKLK